MSFDVARIREDFPILDRRINGHPLVYLDSANTSQKPVQVLDVMRDHFERHNANVSRSVHTLGTEATTAYEAARAKVAGFIGAASPDEVVFTKNSTEAINLLAYASDHAFVTTSLLPHGRSWLTPGMQVASLDHVMWFHDELRVDDWLLHVMRSPAAGGARGLVRGSVFTRDGRLVASTAQEGLIRQRGQAP